MRKHNNPLFPEAEREVTEQGLLEAQRLDHEELSDFITGFRTLVHKAVKLQPNEQSEVILEMKENLDKAYEQAAGLADDQSETKEAIKKLSALIMNAVRTGAGTDQTALQELDQEEQARSAHFELLEHPLVADLLSPDSPVAEANLMPTLLSASDEELTAALALFDNDQLILLCQQGEALFELTEDIPEQAKKQIKLIQSLLA
ncbi:hypothetical protein [Candidatus Vondammii sp. HM_W22]|uniref:hypothetical protein n=1 Tax=Candidatus Vondammii sp. HM_W22 TaxID=2687299 RepID=UPI001F12A53A|nr:hypothetical protein [Candidatus Vondammii sp. HM_W22]